MPPSFLSSGTFILAAALALPAQIPGAVPPPAAPSAPAPARAARRYDINVRNQRVESFLRELARQEGVHLRFLRLLDDRFTLELANASFAEVVEKVCAEVDLQGAREPDGSWVVGSPEEVRLAQAPGKDTAPVEITYRCRHLTVESLAVVLAQAFPALKVFPGPSFKNPALTPQSSGPATPSFGSFGGSGGLGGSPGGSFGTPSGSGFDSGGLSGPGGLSPGGFSGGFPGGFGNASAAADASLRRFDVIIVGPADVARRALAFARKLDSGRQQVRINVRLAEMNEDTSRDLGIVWSLPGVAGGPPAVNFSEVPDPSLAGSGGTAGFTGNGGFKLGSFAHSPVGANLSLHALDDRTGVKTLANPSLLVLDGEKCSILIGEKLLFPKQTGVNAQGNPTFDISELKIGVYLQMAAQIGLDGDVVLSIYPQDSSVTSLETFNGNPYPVVSTREAQTTVRLRSGELLVIGGLRVDTDTKTRSRIPLLGSIPILGSLFGSHGKAKKSSELVLMIQPEVLDGEAPGATPAIRLAAPPARAEAAP